MGSTITTRVPDDIDKKIKKISSIEHLDKSTVVRRLLSKAVQDWQIDHALEQYKDGKITIGRAAQMAGVPLREMIAIAAKKGIPFQYNLDDLKEDFRAAESL
ncbi:MAG: UPF0175 family protein [Euryarchaeota archaeon]|nr:UPF0175 family protein [Euryarchaeota archaeon]MCG2735714.1 UPF0175 family protein [Candidatus Methanoperedenaceae archaeon]